MSDGAERSGGGGAGAGVRRAARRTEVSGVGMTEGVALRVAEGAAHRDAVHLRRVPHARAASLDQDAGRRVGTRLGRTIALDAAAAAPSGRRCLWSFVSGTVISAAAFARRRASGRGRRFASRRRRPTVTTRPPSGARSSLARIAVVPEKRASIPERAAPPPSARTRCPSPRRSGAPPPPPPRTWRRGCAGSRWTRRRPHCRGRRALRRALRRGRRRRRRWSTAPTRALARAARERGARRLGHLGVPRLGEAAGRRPRAAAASPAAGGRASRGRCR